MWEQIPVLPLGAIQATVYGLLLSIGVGGGLVWMTFSARRIGLPADGAVRFGLWAIPMGLLGGRILFVAFRWSLVVDELGWQQIFRLWDGGFALFGVVPGCLLAALCCARRNHYRAADVLDAAAPGAGLALALARFAEAFTSQGVGMPVETPALQWFPLAMPDGYGEWMMPVFLWEGIVGLGLAFLAACKLQSTKRRPLDAASAWLLGLGLTQVLLESLRSDDLLRLGLVKVSQLAAMACVLAVAVRRMILARRAGCTGRTLSVYGAGLVAGVGVCTAVEFALDKTTVPNSALYAVMALSLTGMAMLTVRLGKLGGISIGHPPAPSF